VLPTQIDINTFGELVPFGDPVWYQGWFTPYFNDSHRRFRAAMREWVEREIIPNCFEWEEQKKLPPHIHKKCAEAKWLPGVVGFWPTEYVGKYKRERE
jgi:alkylation response protein AidB-like acyl-CoA dehydrogenase